MSAVNMNTELAAEASAKLVHTCNTKFIEQLGEVANNIMKLEDGELKDELIERLRKFEGQYNAEFLPFVDKVKASIDTVPELKAAFQKALGNMATVNARAVTGNAKQIDPSGIHI